MRLLFAVSALLVLGMMAGFAGESMMGHSHGMDMGGLPETGSWSARDEAGYLFGMMEHHIGAVEMAKGLAETAGDPDVRAWAASIVRDQNREITLMRSIIQENNYSDPGAGAMMRDAMRHMIDHPMSDDAGVNFVAQMIPHHASAIQMAIPALIGTTDERVRAMSRDIIESQAREIYQFREWLDKHGH